VDRVCPGKHEKQELSSPLGRALIYSMNYPLIKRTLAFIVFQTDCEALGRKPVVNKISWLMFKKTIL